MSTPVNCTNSELCTFLRGLEEGYLPTYCSDTNPSVQLRSNPIASKSYQHGKKTVSFLGFPSLMMSRPSTARRGEGKLTLSAEDFLAPIFPMQTRATPGRADSTASEDRYGMKQLGLLAKYDQQSVSWKMSQGLLDLGFQQSYPIFTDSGMMQDGVCWGAEIPEGYISANEYGFTLFTPTATDYKRTNLSTPMFKRRMETRKSAGTLPEQIAWMGLEGMLTPALPEKMMRWPLHWTDLRPLETDKMQQWQHSHGASYQD
tara:strand:+ start:70 stop:846 length:777 start_codon:yes stop_codon:yes gene_type:complete